MLRHALAAVAATIVATTLSTTTAHAACGGEYPNAVAGAPLCQTDEITYGNSKLNYTLTATNTPVAMTEPLSLLAIKPDPVAASATDQFAAAGAPNGTGRPVILWLHGGGFVAGQKTDLQHYAKFFARYGFVSVLPEYDLPPLGDFYTDGAWSVPNKRATNLTVDSVSQSAQRDIQTAVRHLRVRFEDYGINPHRIYAVGMSSGGMTAVRLATRATDTDKPGRDVTPGASSLVSHISGAVSIAGSECFPGAPTSVQLWPYRAPAGSCTVDTNPTGNAPFWMLHGNYDQTLKYDWARAACRAYPAQCGDSRFHLYNRYPINESGPGHGDGSVGNCTLTPTMSQAVGGVWWNNYFGLPIDVYPGGDHFFADPGSCESRDGVTSSGAAAAGTWANMNAPADRPRTVAYRIWLSLYPLASAP